ncbi:MAG: DUF2169 domain-containing protein [Polyangiaceae bacterium]
MGTLLRSYTDGGGASWIALIAKRAYSFESDREARSILGHDEIVRSPVFGEPDAHGFRSLAQDTDLFAAEKLLTDVLVDGHVHARSSVTRVDVALKVGVVSKRVRVHGDRMFTPGATATRFEQPAAFTRLPLTWQRAYGGVDRGTRGHIGSKHWGARKRGGMWPVLAYPRNPLGTGFMTDAEGDGRPTALPNFEDPDDPVTPARLVPTSPDSWLDLPVAAGFGPIDPLTFPRSLFALCPVFETPRRPVRELATGAVLREELASALERGRPASKRIYNCAPAGQAICRFVGGETVSLLNLHPERELVHFQLPRTKPQLLVEPPGCRAREVEPLLQTVRIEPDQGRVTLTWAGKLQVAFPFSEEDCARMRAAAVFA